jgi:hypothetical protein
MKWKHFSEGVSDFAEFVEAIIEMEAFILKESVTLPNLVRPDFN